MNEKEILIKISKNKININKAYEKLYPKPKLKRARFIRLKFKIPDSPGVTIFLKILFLLPVPIFLLKIIFRNNNNVINKDFPLTIKEAINLFAYKKAFIIVNAKDNTKVLIKTI